MRNTDRIKAGKKGPAPKIRNTINRQRKKFNKYGLVLVEVEAGG